MKKKLSVLCTVDKFGFKHPIELEDTPEAATWQPAGMDSGLAFKKAFENNCLEEVPKIIPIEDTQEFEDAIKLNWEWNEELKQWSAHGIEGYWFVVNECDAWMGHQTLRLAAHFNEREEAEYPIDMDYGKTQCENMHKALCILHHNAFVRGQQNPPFKPLKPLNVVKGTPPISEGYDTTDFEIAKLQWERNRTRH